MPGLVSYISSTSFANEMAEMRQQVMEGQNWRISPGRGES